MTSPTRYGCWLGLFALSASLLLGCGGKETPSNDGGPRPDVPKDKDKPKGGDLNNITAEDLRKAAEAAGGKLNDDERPLPPIPKGDPDFVMTAKEWYDLHASGKGTPDKYFEKVIQLTGRVREYRHSTPGRCSLELEAGGNFSNVSCDIRGTDAWKTAFPGQTVTLRGVMYAPHKLLPLEWELVRVEGPAPPTVTVDQLVMEYTTDADATQKKYGNKYLLLTTEILKIEPPSRVNEVRVILKAKQEKPVVVCEFQKAESGRKTEADSLKVGQKVRVLGRFTKSIADNAPGPFHLDQALVLDVLK